MSGINPKEFLEELVFCLKQEDIVKSKALLQFITKPEINPAIQKKALHELTKHSERLVFPILEYLTTLDIPNPDIQESLYELILDKAYGNNDLIVKYIIKNDKRSRLIYMKVAGDLMLADAAPLLESLLLQSEDKEITRQAITALGKIRLPTSISKLRTLLETSRDEEIIKTTVNALAEIRGKDAVDAITASITGNTATDSLKINALGEIQDQYALTSLAALLESRDTDVRDAAIDQLIQIGGKAVPVLMSATQDAGTDFMVHLITTLGYIKDPKALPMILDIMKTKPTDANVRQAAYESMERIPSAKSAIALAVGIQDPVESVRMSAARAMDRNISKVLIAGLNNIVREGSEDALNAVGALIDSDAENIFNFLLQEESFIRLSVKHVTTKADPKTRANFLEILKKKNFGSLADKISKMVPDEPREEKKDGVTIYVVDDSKMMLKLYENKLSGLGYGYKSFISAEQALKEIYASKPDLVITDLNMPKINGLQLSSAIRKKFSVSELPIVMITTQSDFKDSEEANGSEKTQARQAGINKVLHKPFSNEVFNDTLTKYL